MSTKHSRRERNFEFMRIVKCLPCCLCSEGDCDGVVEADHAGSRPFARRAPDETCIPLCSKHHADRTLRNGFFRGMPVMEMKKWCAEQMVKTQRAVMLYEDGMEMI